MVLIHLVEGHLALGKELTHLSDLIERKLIAPLTSELTLAEVMVKPLRDRDMRLQDSYQKLLAKDGPLIVVPISRDILMKAAEVRAAVGGKLPDAIHVATAIDLTSKALITLETRLKHPQIVSVVHLSQIHTLLPAT
jgi:predicted nucleic acid-binding protein